jgi:two-component system NtrC family sensor kinase
MPHDVNSTILIITFTVHAALALYFFARDRKNATNISFSMVLLCLALWAISFVFWAMAADPFWIKFWINMNFFSTSLLPACFLYFSIVFPRADFIRLRSGLFSAFLPALVFAAASFTDLISKGVSPPYVEPEHGQWYLLFAAYVIAYLGYSLYIILSKYKTSDGKEKLQIQYLLLGLFFTSVVGISTNIILVSKGLIMIGPFMINAIGPTSTLVMVGLMTYSIVRYKLLGIDDFLSRGVFFISAAVVIIGSVNIIVAGDIRSLIPFNVILADVAVGFYILFQNRKSEINRSFCALSACLAFWSYATLRFAAAPALSSAEFWGKLVFIGPALFSPIFYYFTYVFPRRIKSLSGAQKILMFLLPAAAISLLSTDFILKGVVMGVGGPSIVFGAGYGVFLAYFIIYGGIGIANMIGKYYSSIGIEKMQAGYLILGAALSAFFAGITSMALPWFNEYRFTAYSPLFTLAFIGATAYAIGVARLLSFEFMMQRGLIYLALSTILTLFYVLAGIASGRPAADMLEQNTLVSFLFFALFASVIYRPVYRYILELSDRLFYGGKYNYQKTLLTLSQGITAVIKLSELINLIVSNFLDNIKVKEISVLIFNENRNRFISAPCAVKTAGRYKRIEFDAGGPIATYLSTKREILVRDEIESEIDKHPFLLSQTGELAALQILRDELEKLGMAAWIPVISKGKLIAIICLGYKLSGDMYTDEDIGLLKILANQLAVSFENSAMYSTITKQYEELKLARDKLSEADRLASLGTMAAGMAHEIKNPLSSMKVFSQLLRERYEDPEFRKKFEEIIPKEINRIDRIVEGLLGFARSPELKLSQVNIQELLEEILTDMKEDAERAGIKIVKRFGSAPNVQADSEQLIRAFSNIILNATQAMASGGKLDIELTEDGPSKAVTVKITDTGHGISKDHLEHIFDPFFTTKHYGTGLGLTIFHSIIEKHKGTIDIQSEEGKGTAVTVTLPVSQRVI